MAVTVVYILSPGHSGSTLLDLLISSHSRVASGGEVKTLGHENRVRVSALKRSCTCGAATVGVCAFWQRVDAAVRASVGRSLEDVDVEHPDPEQFRIANRVLFNALAQVSGCGLVVDSSKSLDRFERLRQVDGLQLRPVRLVRSPYGVVSSYIRSGRGWVPWARHYTRHTLRSRQLLESMDHHLVRYETLATAPRETMAPLMRWLGLDFEERQLAWRDHVHHSIGGNVMRFDSSGEIRLDRRWKRELSPLQKAAIAWMTLPTRFGDVGSMMRGRRSASSAGSRPRRGQWGSA